MSEPGRGPAAALGRVLGIFYAPVATFRGLARSSTWADWVVPLVLGVAGSVALVLLLGPHMDLAGQMRENLEAGGMAPAQIDAAVARQEELFAGPLRYLFVAFQGLAYPAMLALLALLFWGGASAFGGRITYGTTLAVVGCSWLVRMLEAALLLVVVQGGEPVRPDRIPSVLATNPASYLPLAQADTVLYAVLGSLNLFTLWSLGLIAVGLAEAGRLSRSAAFGLVGLLFGVWLAVVAGWAAIF